MMSVRSSTAFDTGACKCAVVVDARIEIHLVANLKVE